MTVLQTNLLLAIVAMCAAMTCTGCGSSDASAEAGGEVSQASAGISPQKFADAVHSVMMADRTVYARHVVTRLKKQGSASACCRNRYWVCGSGPRGRVWSASTG